MPRPILLSLLLLAAACGGASTPADLVDEAQAALGAGKPAEAAATAGRAAEGARAAGDDVLAWRATSLRLVSLGRAGQGAQVLAELPAAEAAWPDQADAKFLNRLISETDKGGDIGGAVKLLQHGVTRFPEHKGLFDERGKLLAKKAAAADSDALAVLKQLGYL